MYIVLDDHHIIHVNRSTTFMLPLEMYYGEEKVVGCFKRGSGHN